MMARHAPPNGASSASRARSSGWIATEKPPELMAKPCWVPSEESPRPRTESKRRCATLTKRSVGACSKACMNGTRCARRGCSAMRRSMTALETALKPLRRSSRTTTKPGCSSSRHRTPKMSTEMPPLTPTASCCGASTSAKSSAASAAIARPIARCSTSPTATGRTSGSCRAMTCSGVSRTLTRGTMPAIAKAE